jgi:hypothetical protein
MRPQGQARSTDREFDEGMEPGFRYLLVRPDCVLADAPAFQTTNSTWKPGDEFIGAEGVQRYRILDMIRIGPTRPYNGLFLLELVEGGMAAPELLRPVGDQARPLAARERTRTRPKFGTR